jgi:PadR family transcriptional regulator AphA
MSLKHGLLGLLNYGEMTGYEIDKSFKESLNFFWQAQTSQIYRELNSMEKLGWLTSKIEYQTDKPNKRLYSITDTGKQELHDWLNNNDLIGSFQIRNEFLMKLFFSGDRNTEDSIKMLKEYKKGCLKSIALMDKTDDSIEYYSSGEEKSNRVLYWELTASFGKCYAKMCLDWADNTIKKLEGLL